MKIQFIEPNDLPESSGEFRKYFDSWLDLCEFKVEEKLGVLFYLGATLPGKLSHVVPDSVKFQQYLQVFSLYSKSTGDFSDYNDLNDAVLNAWIYNANLAISKITSDEGPIGENLRSFPVGDVIVGKEDPIPEFLDLFTADAFSLQAIQNLNDQVFMQTGLYLKEKNYTSTRAYEAGFAYRMMMFQMDVKGTNYLLSRISNNFSPLFQSLFYAPLLFVFNPQAFKANHLFSHIFNNFIGGIESNHFQVVQIIHRYHQIIFYKENSIELRDEWPFNKEVDDGSAALVFVHALNIHRTKLNESADLIKQSGEVYDPTLISAKIDVNDFLKAILEVIQSKYSINGYEEFVAGAGAKWNTNWNNKGDYIQFLVILFYETCLHALVVDEIY